MKRRTRRTRRPETKRHRKVGLVLMELRHAYRHTQKDLAAHLQVSPRTLLRWENGYALPKEAQLKALVSFVADYDEDDAERIANAYGSSLAALGIAKEAETSTVAIESHRGAAEMALYVAADELETRAAKVRGAIVKMLGTLGALGLTCEEARGLIAPVEG